MRKGKESAGKLRHFLAAGLAAYVLFGAGIQADAATLKDLFDEHYYVDHNPGLQEVYGYNREALWRHFVKHGLKEGRIMNNLLDIVNYRRQNPDLEEHFGDDWDAYLNHYLTIGAKEGRRSWTEFDPMYYAGRYEDLREAYGEDVLALWHHYNTYGAAEGREPQASPVAVGATELETEYAYQVFEILNRVRAENGVNTLIMTQGLMDAAQLRAQELEVLFSHDRPDGTFYTTAFDQCGVNYYVCCESIGAGHRSPEAIMEGWMNSTGHRGNILNAQFEYHYVGVGCFIKEGSEYGKYWTLTFMV